MTDLDKTEDYCNELEWLDNSNTVLFTTTFKQRPTGRDLLQYGRMHPNLVFRPKVTALTHSKGLASVALDTFKDAMKSYGVDPSSHLDGIEAVITKLVEMAEGKARPNTFLSQLDPGIGKTTTAVHFIKALLQSEKHRDVAVLYCVSRLEEIDSLIAQLGNENVGVFTRNEDYNAKGRKPPQEARVLLTTQQMVDSRSSRAAAFADLHEFQYMGRNRQVKIWDEALMPAEEITIDLRRLMALPDVLAQFSAPLANRLIEVAAEVREAAAGSAYQFFNPSEYGVTYEAVRDRLQQQGQLTRIREAAHNIWKLAGKTVRVGRDRDNNVLLDYRDHLPDDFFPVLVLDASGRVRATYEFQDKHRKNLVRLTEASKGYDNLRVHVWDRGGGKDAWRKASSQSEMLDAIVAEIDKKQDQRWLVVLHKEDDWESRNNEKIPNLEASIRGAVSNPGRVSFVTWGNAHASNEYADIPNVILAGTLFYPKPVYEVRARASMGLSAQEALSEEAFKKLELGEHKHLILQAACRGAIRKCVGKTSSPMDLYLIATKRTGIRAALPEIFPCCTDIRDWLPSEKPITGRAKDMLDYLAETLKRPGQTISMATVMAKMGVKDKSNFNRLWKQNEALLKAGIRATSINGSSRLTHFRKEI